MDPFEILARHYEPGSGLYRLLVIHSALVTRKALEIAAAYRERHPGAALDIAFIEEAGMLHDIGVKHCRAPAILCLGTEPYILHGVRGREMLEREGLPRHALVCERHIGAGISADDVRGERLPLPERDYLPLSLEERILCAADKFYSKDPDRLWVEKTPESIRTSLSRWGRAVLERWDAIEREFLTENPPSRQA